jgi:S1-C subfamily serine protease
MRGAVLLLLACLGACSPAPEADLRLVTIHNAETGFSLRELPPPTLRSLGLPYGLAVVRMGGVAERAGLRIGDVVYGLNHKQVRSLEEFNRLLAQQASGSIGLLVRRGHSDFYVSVDFGAGALPRAPKGVPPARDTLLRT